jgi:hypothetical protein
MYRSQLKVLAQPPLVKANFTQTNKLRKAACCRSAVADVVQAWRRGRACDAGLMTGDCFAALAMTAFRNDSQAAS